MAVDSTLPSPPFARAVPLVCLVAGIFLGTQFAGAREPTTATSLLATSETVVGERIVYPVSAPAKVTAAIVTLRPGDETGWHTHGVPVFGYVLDGEVTVDYGPRGTRVFRTGDGLMEAMGVAHNGRNTGAGTTRILAVFMGAEGVPNTRQGP